MPLTLISGPAGSGKTDMVLELLAGFTTNRMALCVLPSEAAAFELRRRYILGKEVVLGDPIVTFGHFIKYLANEARPVISDLEQSLILLKVLGSSRLSYFKAPSIGIARQAAEAITTLKKNFISAQELGHILGARRAPRERDLLSLFEGYEKEKRAKGLADDGDLARGAFENIAASPLLDEIKLVVFHGFHHFTPGQMKIIGALHERGIGVNVTLPEVQEEKSLFAPHLKRTLDALDKLGPKVIRLERKDGSAPPKVKNVVLRSPFQETRFLVQEIGKAVAGGTPAGDIAICLRRGGRKLTEIIEGLEEAGLAVKTHGMGGPLAAPVVNESLATKFVRSLAPTASVAEYASAVTCELKRICAGTDMRAVCDRAVARSIISLSRIEAALKALTAASAVAAAEKVTKETFLGMLISEGLSSYSSANDILQMTQIRIVNFEDDLMSAPELLFVPHMTEGNIPGALKERLFFSSEGSFDAVFAGIFPPPSFVLAEEELFFDRLASKIACEIVLSHSAIDDSGGETTRSEFLDPYGDPVPVDVPLPPPLHCGKARIERAIAVERDRMIGGRRNEFQGAISDSEAKALVRERFTEGAVTPSQIESYAQCPFKFFAETVLNLRPPEEITPEIRSKDMGKLVHAVLERFYSSHMEVFKKAAENESKMKNLDRAMDKVVEEIFIKSAPLIGYMADGLRPHEQKNAKMLALQVVFSDIETVRSLSAPLFPSKLEWSFGREPRTVLKLKVKNEPDAMIRGRIDRIDAPDDGSCFTVVDYKTGRKVSSIIKKMKDGLHVQIPLYVEAVRRFLMPGATPVGGMLFSVRKPEDRHGFLKREYNDVHYSFGRRSHSLLDDDAWEAALAESLETAAGLVAKIRSANFEVKPKTCPRHCDYEDVCRYSGKESDELAEKGD